MRHKIKSIATRPSANNIIKIIYTHNASFAHADRARCVASSVCICGRFFFFFSWAAVWATMSVHSFDHIAFEIQEYKTQASVRVCGRLWNDLLKKFMEITRISLTVQVAKRFGAIADRFHAMLVIHSLCTRYTLHVHMLLFVYEFNWFGINAAVAFFALRMFVALFHLCGCLQESNKFIWRSMKRFVICADLSYFLLEAQSTLSGCSLFRHNEKDQVLSFETIIIFANQIWREQPFQVLKQGFLVPSNTRHCRSRYHVYWAKWRSQNKTATHYVE